MKQMLFLIGIFFGLVLGTSAFAEAPRLLTLQNEALLPGSSDGAQHGVTIRRGSGFPEPIVIEAPKEVVEGAPAPPSSKKKQKKKKRKRGW
jgi:hypothetical protein